MCFGGGGNGRGTPLPRSWSAESRGSRKGVIVDLEKAVSSIQKAVELAEDAAGFRSSMHCWVFRERTSAE